MTEVSEEPAVGRTGRSPRIPGLTARHIGQLMVHLSDLLDAGCPLSRALDAVARQKSTAPLARLAGALHAEIVNGASLAGAMGRMGRHFSEVQVSMVRAAETGGFLTETLAGLADAAARQADTIRQIKAKLAYPAVLAATAAASVIFLMSYVVPRFSGMYLAAKRVLPGPTRVLLAVSRFSAEHWLALIAAAALGVIGAWALLRWEPFRRKWDGLLLRLPVLAGVLRDWEMCRFARTMSLLLTGGVPALRSLHLSVGVVGNRAVREEIDQLASAVERGEPLSGPMKSSRFFDATTTEMIVVSEASGKLAATMAHLAGQRHRNFQTRVETLLNLLEPAIILIVGVVVGFTVLALLLPVLLMNTLVG